MRSLSVIVIAVWAVVLCFGALLFVGSAQVSFSDVWHTLTGQMPASSVEAYIVIHVRLPLALTALLAGMALAASGLLMQTLMENPLADASLMGVHAGASVGAAVAVLLLGCPLAGYLLSGWVLTTVFSLVGALGVMALLVAISSVVRRPVVVLVIGLMLSYVLSSLIALMCCLLDADRLQQFFMWGMGSFSHVSWESLPCMAVGALIGIAAACLLVKPLDALLLGDIYARNCGVPVGAVRRAVMLSVGILAAVVTAFCGPIAFVGMAVPQMTRLLLPSATHRLLLPVCMLLGAVVTLSCSLLISFLPGGISLPVNALTPLFGVPVILYVLLSRRRKEG